MPKRQGVRRWFIVGTNCFIVFFHQQTEHTKPKKRRRPNSNQQSSNPNVNANNTNANTKSNNNNNTAANKRRRTKPKNNQATPDKQVTSNNSSSHRMPIDTADIINNSLRTCSISQDRKKRDVQYEKRIMGGQTVGQGPMQYVVKVGCKVYRVNHFQ